MRPTAGAKMTVLLVSEFAHPKWTSGRVCPSCRAHWRLKTNHGRAHQVWKDNVESPESILDAFGNNVAVECCRWKRA